MKYMFLNALKLKYEAEIEVSKANVRVYLDNPVGIGEHPDLVAAVDSQLEVMANAKDKLKILFSGDILHYFFVGITNIFKVKKNIFTFELAFQRKKLPPATFLSPMSIQK